MVINSAVSVWKVTYRKPEKLFDGFYQTYKVTVTGLLFSIFNLFL